MTSKLLNDLNKLQVDAVTYVKDPTLILAGAGSGKTRVLTYKAAYLIMEKGYAPESILMVTFTNKAAGEMKDRIARLVKSATQPHASTFHSLCARILRRQSHLLAFNPYFSIYDDNDQKDAVKEVMRQLSISGKNFNPSAILHTISQAKNELIDPNEYSGIAHGFFQETVALIYKRYQAFLLENQAMDFDDLLVKTYEVLTKFPDVKVYYQKQFQYILVDEYQDTNKSQYELTKLFNGNRPTITVVGDASQSIYRWRGANYRNILNFKEDYETAVIFNLEQNYRSTQNILNAAYGVISKISSHPILKLWTDKNGGSNITLYEARNERDEAQFITQTILQSGKSFQDSAVLYRTNAQSRVIEEAFLHAGIPYILVGGTRFYERKEIKDVLSYLTLIANPTDLVAYKRAEKIGKKRLEKLQAWIENKRNDNLLVGLSTLELLDDILEVTQYAQMYDANVEEEAYRLENIKEMRSVATEFPDLSDFLENVALTQQEYVSEKAKMRDQERATVTMMTFHAAKGLEFDTVYMTGMEEGLFPHSRALFDKEELDEERRLCYVGITRAKEKLYMTFCNHRLYFGTRTQNMVSRFISDVPEELIEFNASIEQNRNFANEDYLI